MTSILSCVTDSPNARRVIQCSVAWARALGHAVRFVHFGGLGSDGRARLNELIEIESSGTAAMELLDSHGDVADAVCELAAEMPAAYVVIGAVARERAVRDLIGSTARRVAKRAPCSVVLVSTTGRDPGLWMRFVIGVDFSAWSIELASAVLRVARLSTDQPEICFAHEYGGQEPEPRRRPASGPPMDSAVRVAAQQHQLSSFIGALDTQGVTANAVALPGRPGQEIARYAEDLHADLLGVIGPTRALGTIDRLMSHPIVLLLDRLPCSVLLFRPPDGRSTQEEA